MFNTSCELDLGDFYNLRSHSQREKTSLKKHNALCFHLNFSNFGVFFTFPFFKNTFTVLTLLMQALVGSLTQIDSPAINAVNIKE